MRATILKLRRRVSRDSGVVEGGKARGRDEGMHANCMGSMMGRVVMPDVWTRFDYKFRLARIPAGLDGNEREVLRGRSAGESRGGGSKYWQRPCHGSMGDADGLSIITFGRPNARTGPTAAHRGSICRPARDGLERLDAIPIIRPDVSPPRLVAERGDHPADSTRSAELATGWMGCGRRNGGTEGVEDLVPDERIVIPVPSAARRALGNQDADPAGQGVAIRDGREVIGREERGSA
jgi:hypothetical protein